MRFLKQSPRLYLLIINPIILLLLIFCLSGKAGSYSTSQSFSSSIFTYFTGHPFSDQYKIILDDVLTFLRKPAHVTLYGLFSLSIFFCIRRLLLLPVLHSYVWTLGICLICASFDELYQYMNKDAGRTGSMKDVILDFIAAFVVLGFYDIWKRRIKRL